MKKITAPLFLTLTLAISNPVAALVYQWPYIQTLNVRIMDSTTAHFSIATGTITVDDPEINSDATVNEVLNKKMGKNIDQVEFMTFHRHNNPRTHLPALLSYNTLTKGFRGTDTFASYAAYITGRFGKGVWLSIHEGSPNGGECVGITLGPSPTTEPTFYESWITQTWNGGATSVADSCYGTPPPNQWCALITPQLTLNYEKMNLANAPGARVSGQVAVECTTGMKYTLRVRNPQGIPLSNGMTANLLANNLPLNSALSGKTGRNNVEITSVLSGTPRSTGPFEGSGVLFVSYP
jgi:hypothetical protein